MAKKAIAKTPASPANAPATVLPCEAAPKADEAVGAAAAALLTPDTLLPDAAALDEPAAEVVPLAAAALVEVCFISYRRRPKSARRCATETVKRKR